MNSFAYLVLVGWLPAAVLACYLWRPKHVALPLLLIGWLFLPVLEIDLPFLPDYNKATAVSYALLISIVLFDGNRLMAWRPQLIDVAAACWLVAPPIASLVNGYGAYDASAALLHRFFHWGVPYLVGALYCRSDGDLRRFVVLVFVLGLAYAPLCLYEVRMSPQLHRILYGEFQHSFGQTIRGGGYRPVVFTRHGLEASLFMAAAVVAGVAMWWRLRMRALAGVPMLLLVPFLIVAFVLCKSTGAFVLGALGCLLLLPGFGLTGLWALACAVPMFLCLRVFGGGVIEQWMLDQAAMVSDDRAQSLQYRFDMEQFFLSKFWAQPMFGSTPWSFGVWVDPEQGNETILTSDSMWIIAAVTNGLLGLFGFVGLLWLPVVRAQLARGLLAVQARPELAAASILVLLYLVDCLFNGFVSPLYIAMAGGVSRAAGMASLVPSQLEQVAEIRQAEPAHKAAPFILRPRPAGMSKEWRSRRRLLSPRPRS